MKIKPYRPFTKLIYALALFCTALVVGTVGYMAIEHYNLLDAFYMTIITISTVGYGEVNKLSDAGRVFTIVLIIFDLTVFAYTISHISTYFLQGEFSEEYKLYKMKKSIAELNGHVIICGFGRNGRAAAQVMHDNGKDFVVMDKVITKPTDEWMENHFFLQADATRDEGLKQAGIDKATALIATLPADADNVFVVLTARELNPNLKIISRASHGSSVKKLKIAGANNVIRPDKLGGTHMATMVLSPDIKEFVDLLSSQNSAAFCIREIECLKPLLLDTLNGWQKTGATVLGLKTVTNEYKINPPPGTTLTPGQRLIAMGSDEQLNKLSSLIDKS